MLSKFCVAVAVDGFFAVERAGYWCLCLVGEGGGGGVLWRVLRLVVAGVGGGWFVGVRWGASGVDESR